MDGVKEKAQGKSRLATLFTNAFVNQRGEQGHNTHFKAKINLFQKQL